MVHIIQEVFRFFEFFFSLTLWYRTKMRTIVPNTNCFKLIILNCKTFIDCIISNIIYFLYIWGQYFTHKGEGNPQGRIFFTVGIFKKNILKYAKLMFEPYISDNLNQIYHFFLSYFKRKVI